jgi:hypothetical protein
MTRTSRSAIPCLFGPGGAAEQPLRFALEWRLLTRRVKAGTLRTLVRGPR